MFLFKKKGFRADSETSEMKMNVYLWLMKCDPPQNKKNKKGLTIQPKLPVTDPKAELKPIIYPRVSGEGWNG